MAARCPGKGTLKLGTRVTVVATLLVAAVLAGSGYAALKVRRANLEADLDREAHEIADRAARRHRAARSGDTGRRRRCWPARRAAAPARRAVQAGGAARSASEQRTDDDAWLMLMRGGRHPGRAGRPPVRFVRRGRARTRWRCRCSTPPRWTLPPRHPARHPTAIMGMRRDAGYIDAEVAATAAPHLPAVPAGAWSAWRSASALAIAQIVVRPLRRLLEGIDAVGKGDLSRVILAERDDEIGTHRRAVQRDDRLAARGARGGGARRRARAWRWRRGCASRRSWPPSARWRPRSRTSSARRSTSSAAARARWPQGARAAETAERPRPIPAEVGEERRHHRATRSRASPRSSARCSTSRARAGRR